MNPCRLSENGQYVEEGGESLEMSIKSSQFIFLRNCNEYTIYKDVIYKIKLNRNIPLLSWVLKLKTNNKTAVAEREHS